MHAILWRDSVSWRIGLLAVGYYNTFVVRIWCNDSGEATRGYVQHVNTKEQRYFSDVAELIYFIRGQFSPPMHDTGMRDKKTDKHLPTKNDEGFFQDVREL